MQAPASSGRLEFGQVRKAVLALGVIAMLAVGAATVGIIQDDASTVLPDGAGITTDARVPSSGMIQFLEQNTQLPARALALAGGSSMDWVFMEQNTQLPGVTAPATVESYHDVIFLEQNVWDADSGTFRAPPEIPDRPGSDVDY